MKERLKAKYQQFREWQKQPHQVKPLSDAEHDCATCGTHYQGNYCPRCGQSATVGRYSFKNAFLLFLDVWGLGNRGMFRTLRDLLLRPGYMIRDYLQGMQMAYFPPFKMFFLLVAFSVIVDSGLNIKGENRLNKVVEQFNRVNEEINGEIDDEDAEDKEKADLVDVKEKGALMEVKGKGDLVDVKVKADLKDASAEEKAAVETILSAKDLAKKAFDFIDNHQTIILLLWLLIFSAPLYLFFRRCPNIPDIRYSEFFVAMVYTTNMMTILGIVFGLFCLSTQTELLCYILSLVPLKQLSGYSYKRTTFYVIAAFTLLIITVILISAIGFGAWAILTQK
jgi:hypothetical protein